MKTTSKVSKGTPAHFSGHETFPLRQMWLKKAFDQAIDSRAIHKSTFADETAIAAFGVGKNMVASIRHWALACGVMYDAGPDEFRVGSLAVEILQDGGLDPYAENPSTAWLAHWQLAGRCFRSTTWHWLFNHVTAPTFTRQELEEPLSRYARELDAKHRLSASTISRDLETCLRSYAPRSAGGSPEDFAEPLLGELGLLQEVHKGQYAFRRGPKASLHDGVFAYALVDFWDREADGQSALAFETVVYGEGSPGRVFKLDEESIAQRLLALSDFTAGKLAWTDSAGLRQVHRKPISKEDRRNLIRRAYE
ncbi:DUF4007 family protein [Burkholderia vietnamiensis]|uniref:DUF4007 family protein n=2 Tax=Burkholderia vietnamiensis TaxID=60552 RepID=UPI002018F8C9|nr:DUF4007 family protein [Burkholderia vietnamiensis]MCO1350607.1 DUF4007 family protein [Burkholderia vietnamiensis]UQN46787.1 DUF4007 family protein [Burkholderia vietnamiensis]